MLTRNEVFNTVAAHLLRQGKRARIELDVVQRIDAPQNCLYRTPDGLKCAAGCLILDEHYNNQLEGYGVSNPMVAKALRASGVADEELSLVAALQRIHDMVDPKLWAAALWGMKEALALSPHYLLSRDLYEAVKGDA